jgi:hypothetical protein
MDFDPSLGVKEHFGFRLIMPNQPSGRGASMKGIVLAILATVLAVSPVLAETWYLMAPDPKSLQDPMVLHRMEQGMVTSSLQLKSVASFQSRAECEVARRKFAEDWRNGRLTNMEWHQIGTTSPDWFVTCSSPSDPRMTTSPAK